MEAIIKEVYESNFGTAYETYKEAVKKDNSIRLQDVKDYLSKRDDIQVKSKTKSYNSCVSPGANFEYEIDLMDIESKGATSNTRYGLIAIDNFTKVLSVAPIKNKTPEEMIKGLKIIITSMGKPKQLYSDEESSMRSAKMIRFLKESDIKSIQTTTHAHTVERAIRTFKDNLYRRLDSLKQDTTNWIKHIDNIFRNIIQLSTALLKSSLLKLVIKRTIYGLTGIFKIMRKATEHTLKLKQVIWLEFT